MSTVKVPGCPAGSHAAVPLSEINLFDPERLSCPHATWSQLRREAPVYRVPMPGVSVPIFMITRRADIDYVARHPEVFSNAAIGEAWRWGDFPPEIESLFTAKGYKVVHTLQSSDAPVHPVYRKIAEAELTLPKVNAMKPRIDELVENLIAALPENEPFNFVDRYSVLLPLQVICLILGLPTEDAGYLRRETDLFCQLVDPSFSLEQAMEGAKAVVEGYDYFASHIQRLRGHPDGSLMGAIANERKPNGELLSMDEALSMAQVVAIGGNETTRNALSSCARILASQKTIWTTLKENRALIPAFLEEVLRTNGPSNATMRRALADTEIGGVTIPTGSGIFVMWSAGGTDDSVFADALTIDLDRKNKRAHTAFGVGVHFCIGHHLARAEIQSSINAWLNHFDRMELAVAEPDVRYEPMFGFRMLNRLPIRIVRAAISNEATSRLSGSVA
jgi:cytochrome P450